MTSSNALDRVSNAGNIFLGVFAIATIRDFLEVALEGIFVMNASAPLQSLKTYFLHFNTFYFLVWATLSLLLFLFTRKKTTVSECFKTGALAMMLIWVGPLFDYFAVGAFDMFYPPDPIGVFKNLHRLADPTYSYEGMSKGMRVEILLAGAGAVGFIFYKTRNILSSVLGGFCISIGCLLIGTLIPIITQYYEYGTSFGRHELYDSTLLHQGFVVHGTGSKIALFYISLCIVLLALAYFIRSRERFMALVGNFRWTRAMHYLVLFFGGAAFIYFNPPVLGPEYEGYYEYMTTIWEHPSDIFGIVMAAVAVLLSFESAVIVNDVYDFDIDAVSNSDRPLVTKAIPDAEYRAIGKIFTATALTIAFAVNETFFFLIVLYNLAAFLYSAPPFRLRRYFIVSNVELAAIFIITFLAGTTTLLDEYRLRNVPTYIVFGLLASYVMAMTVKDCKDYDGDKRMHIQTLQTVFGQKIGNILAVILVCCSILLTPVMLHLHQLTVFSITVCLLFLASMIVTKKYKTKEWLVTLLYYIYVITVFYFLIKPI